MTMHVRWPVPAGRLALGLQVLRLSYGTYAKWQEYLALDDHSGAEVYEVGFWPAVSVSVLLILLGAFPAGRWSVRRPFSDLVVTAN